MNVTASPLPGVLVVEPKVYRDDRGHFVEAWSQARYEAAGLPMPFVQDNLSVSRRGVLRGLHLQNPHGQGKLVMVLQGSVFDVAVDVRVGSPHFGQWYGVELSGESGRQLYIPPGFAHGFAVTSAEAVFLYKCTTTYRPDCELSVRWDDPALGIAWPVADPVLSPKDAQAPLLNEIAPDRLPRLD